MAKVSRVELLKSSQFSLNPPSGKVVFIRDERIEPVCLPLVPAVDVDSRIPYPLLNPLQSAFYYTYNGGSALVCSPTSSGKSLVAHLFMMKNKGRKVYTAPTKALVYEKAVELKRYYQVDVRTGDQVLESFKPLKGDVLVCTYEYLTISLRNKANWIKDVGCVVVDEIHQIIKRPSLEEAITYLLDSGVPLLGLSATVPRDEELGDWLGVSLLLRSSWRPVALEKSVVPLVSFDPIEGKGKAHGERESLVASRLLNALLTLKRPGEKVILFVPKKNLGWSILEIANRERIGVMNETVPFEKLQREPEIAFHNADVPKEEREAIEKAFRDGNLDMLIATQTLAYGVNLPADRVLIFIRLYWDREEKRHRALPDSLDIIQMEGRAGRLGIREVGYSNWLVYGGKEETLNRIVKEEFDSSLRDRVRGLDWETLTMFVLLGVHHKGRDYKQFLERTFSFRDFTDRNLEKVLEFLESRHYIDNGKITQKGAFCISADISPVALERYLVRKSLDLPRMVLIRPLLGKKRFDSLYPFVEKGDSFKEDYAYVHGLISKCYDCTRDNTDQFVFYTEGLLVKYENIKNPPGEFSYLGTDAIHLIKKLISMSKVGLYEKDARKILESAHSVKTGISPEYAGLSGIKGIGHIRANLIKRLLVQEGIKAPMLGERVEVLYNLLPEERWEKGIMEMLMEYRKFSKELAKKETNRILSILKNNIKGYMVDDKILLAYSVYLLGASAIKMRKKELIEMVFGV